MIDRTLLGWTVRASREYNTEGGEIVDTAWLFFVSHGGHVVVSGGPDWRSAPIDRHTTCMETMITMFWPHYTLVFHLNALPVVHSVYKWLYRAVPVIKDRLNRIGATAPNPQTAREYYFRSEVVRECGRRVDEIRGNGEQFPLWKRAIMLACLALVDDFLCYGDVERRTLKNFKAALREAAFRNYRGFDIRAGRGEK